MACSWNQCVTVDTDSTGYWAPLCFCWFDIHCCFVKGRLNRVLKDANYIVTGELASELYKSFDVALGWFSWCRGDY